MQKKIQTFALLFGLCIGLAGHHATFALEPCTDPVEQNDFFGKKKQSILHIGVKGWMQGTKKVIEKHWTLGYEIVIGPVVEWHFLNGIGFQTGLLYSYNGFFSVDFSVDRKRLLDTSFFSFGRSMVKAINALSAACEGYIAHAGLNHIQFHAISLPLFFRLYPEKSRQLVCYGGPRFMVICAGLEKKQYCPVRIDTSTIKNILYDALKQGKRIGDDRGITIQDIQNISERALLEIYHSIFKIKPDRTQHLPFCSNICYWDWCWDFGVEFRGASGLILGVNGLGFVLGYDFVK